MTIKASDKANDKLVISRSGWNENDPVQLAFTVSAVAKDVLAGDLGGLKQVTLNTNAPEQVLSFPLTFNGAAATSGTVTIVPDSVTLDCKNVEADVDSMDNCVINITKLTGKSGSIKVTLAYSGGVTMNVTVGVSLGK